MIVLLYGLLSRRTFLSIYFTPRCSTCLFVSLCKNDHLYLCTKFQVRNHNKMFVCHFSYRYVFKVLAGAAISSGLLFHFYRNHLSSFKIHGQPIIQGEVSKAIALTLLGVLCFFFPRCGFASLSHKWLTNVFCCHSFRTMKS